MLRNDYRRALIMLRPHVLGMSGHVRLERRTLAGTMRFTVQGAPQGTLHAALMANTGGHWIIYRLGALKNDQRGQSGMIASFDPRNLRGLDLDRYTLIAIVSTGNGEAELVMSGMVNGYKDVNWADAAAAATSEYAPRRRVVMDDLVGADSIQVQPVEAGVDDLVGADSISAREFAETGETPTAETEAASVECCCEDADGAQAIIEVFEAAPEDSGESAQGGILYTEWGWDSEQEADKSAIVESEAGGDEQDADATEQAADATEQAADATEQDADATEQDADATEQDADAAEQATDAAEQTASETRALAWELLKLDPGISWPSDIEAVRELFERAQATDAFKLDDFVFVEAPLPNENGADGICAIGLKSQGGRPVSVCYALPGSYSIQAPPGLEDYMYLGGWWYTVLDVV